MESAKMGTKAMLSAQGTMAGITTKIFQLDQKNDKLSQRRVKTLTNVVDITGDYLSNVDAIGTEEFRSLDFNKQIRDAVKAKLPTEESYLRTLKAEHDIQKKLNNEINTQSDLIKKSIS